MVIWWWLLVGIQDEQCFLNGRIDMNLIWILAPKRDNPTSRSRRDHSAWRYHQATQFLGDVITGPSHPGWGSIQIETVDYGHEPRE
jgi:hypothetical protein